MDPSVCYPAEDDLVRDVKIYDQAERCILGSKRKGMMSGMMEYV